MLKVLHIYKDYFPPVFGGIEKHMSLLCNELAPIVDVDVLVANRRGWTVVDIVNGIRVVKAATFGRFYSAPVSPSFLYYLGRERRDILHFHLPNPTAVLAYLMVRPPGKVVVTWHSDIVRQAKFLPVYRPFLNRFLNLSDVVLPTTDRYAQSSPFLKDFLHKCEAIPLGVDASQFEMTPNIEEKTAALRSEFGDRVVLFVGLLRYYKGLQYLIKAMRDVDARLVVVGEGPMSAELHQLTSKLGLADRVSFVGRVAEEMLPAYYHCCDVFCLPSVYRSEAFGFSQVEAMVCGKPVVSTGLDTGVPYVNLDGKTGLVVPPMDSAALASAINMLLSDKDLARDCGENGRARASKELSSKSMARSVLAVYRRLVETR
ncbi:MAG: glycosyltransferase [Candidatus Coatesbacteria bacterium]|nr:glycosyltransferase [Candidatus Coatesbacteria bacterium]